ncbi:MAG: hypothetical protein J6Y62_01430 [Clostridia bacterium]|nr:hypothetical protein [Clostridia bacterium]
MKKEISIWLRENNFDEDRSYYHVWYKETDPVRLTEDREALIRLELSSEGEEPLITYKGVVSIKTRGTTAKDYSEDSAWLFTRTGTDIKALVAECIDSAKCIAQLYGQIIGIRPR